MYQIVTDVQIGRRLRAHHVVDEHNTVRFTTTDFADALDWVRDQGITRARVSGLRHAFLIDFEPTD